MPRNARIAAVVFLRSISGKSVSEFGQGRLPDDLEPYRASQDARERVQRAFAERGFRAYWDRAELTLSIQGSPALFASCFSVPEQSLSIRAPEPGPLLQPPDEISELIETIALLPPAEMA